jgi:hypothetical protein
MLCLSSRLKHELITSAAGSAHIPFFPSMSSLKFHEEAFKNVFKKMSEFDKWKRREPTVEFAIRRISYGKRKPEPTGAAIWREVFEQNWSR